MKLSQSQFRAVAHGAGPMLCLAGPGSGKTQVLIQRIKYLILERGIRPENILVVTFSRAAAAQMQDRFHKLEQMEGARVTFGTFHSIFLAILRNAYGKNCASIITEAEKKEILKEILSRLKLSIREEEMFFSSLSLELAKVKTEEIPLEHYYASSCGEEEFRRIYTEYQRSLLQQNKMEFDDILLFCRDLLREREDILSFWQERFQYLLVDEYQDINLLQYQVVGLLAKRYRNIFIVGDDDQSIYRFRGARPELMKKFLKDHPDAEVVHLEENYRSTVRIVESAVELIRHNEDRFSKVQRSTGKEGETVKLFVRKDRNSEITHLIGELRKRRESGMDWKDMAILYRTKGGTALLTDTLMGYQIPFQIAEGIFDIFSHWIAKDLSAYLRLAEGRHLRADLVRILNRPNRYLPSKVLLQEQISLEAYQRFYEGRPQERTIERLRDDLSFLKCQPLFSAIQYIRKVIGYENYLREYAQDKRVDLEELFSVLEELQESARPFLTLEDWEGWIAEFRRRLEEEKKEQKAKKDGVVLSTLHASKGLEFPFVAVMDVVEGVIPHRKAKKEADLEEERRLFYVGMTRAKEELYLYTCDRINRKERKRSGFLEEISTKEIIAEEEITE